jgi:hypothetical protein
MKEIRSEIWLKCMLQRSRERNACRILFIPTLLQMPVNPGNLRRIRYRTRTNFCKSAYPNASHPFVGTITLLVQICKATNFHAEKAESPLHMLNKKTRHYCLTQIVTGTGEEWQPRANGTQMTARLHQAKIFTTVGAETHLRQMS